MTTHRSWALPLALFCAILGISAAAQAADHAPLYYQAPDGQPAYSSTPKKTTDGRDFVPVYTDNTIAAHAVTATNAQPAIPPSGKGKILYYRNPMGLPDTSPTPKKDSMGMDYIPVYENEAQSGSVQISPDKLQLLGVRTVPVETRATLAQTIRAPATVQLNERGLGVVTTKVGGWAEKLLVAATGETVKRGDPLLDIYAPELVAVEEEYLIARGLGGHHGDMGHGNPQDLINGALQRLRALGVPEEEIARLKQSGKAAHLITLRSPGTGIVIEKPVVEGMRVEPDTVLYRTADLSSVWLMAQVQERDLGRVAKDQHVRASFVALPGRSFEGVVDFIYPSLSPETRTAQVRIVVPNPDLVLRAAMYASVEIDAPSTSTPQKIATVPDSAVIDSGMHQVVLVELGAGRFEPRAVRLGARGNGTVEVLEGLKEGERVVVGANFLIHSESNLRAALQSFTPSAGGSQ